jgi:hypothetical protein
VPKPSSSCLLLLALVVAGVADLHAGSDGIRAEDLRRDVTYLASDELTGRETGQPGIRKAEKYIAREFKKAGLVPLPGLDDYWVDFSLYRSGYDEGGTSVKLNLDGRSRQGRPGVDFKPFSFSDEGKIEGPVVFAGYGITAPEHAYDDYDGLDVEGKIVLVLRHEPAENDPASSFDGASSSRHALFTAKATNAQAHGARGMLLVTDPANHGPDDDLRLGGTLRLTKPKRRNPADEDSSEPFLALHVSQEMAASLVASAGHTLAALQRAVDDGASPSTLALEGVSARVAVKRSGVIEKIRARNVVGFLEGRDPVLADEWIVIGGHHDHVGAHPGEGDTIYNGADDNASGTSGVIALARAFASGSEKPRRSILFVTFSAEEKGLLGSRALVGQQLIPVEKIVFMLNIDMIGRNPERSLELVGDGYTNGLREIVETVNRGTGLELGFAGAAYAGNSDHDAFFDEEIPFLFFFTGTHEDYHQPGDHAEKLDYERMESILRLAHGVVRRLSDADAPPRFIDHVNWLGLRIEVLEDPGEPQAVITGVDDESRGAAGGIRVGDVVTTFDGNAVHDPERIGREFRDVEPGHRIAVVVQRGEKELTLIFQRAKTGYLGVFLDSLDADRRRDHGLHDDEGLLLRDVVENGPSAQAGLKAGDIVVALAGRSVGRASLGRRLMQIGAGETIDVTLIRDGERLTLPLKLGELPERD